MQRDNDAPLWGATAAYLYILHLDGPALAWEYLRRHPEYRQNWRRRRRVRAPVDAALWGLVQWEDPDQDARRAHPVWAPPLFPVLHITVADDPALSCGQAFDLWHIPGRKELIAAGTGFSLQVRQHHRVLRARLDAGALTDRPCTCTLPFDARESPPLAEFHALMAPRGCSDLWAACGYRRSPRADRTRTYRAATLHLRALQALDGALAGASQRQIGEVLFGTRAVHEHWHADSLLRAQVRHNLLRGQSFMRGGYRELFGLRQA